MIIAFGEYQKSQNEMKVKPIPALVAKKVIPVNTKISHKPKAQKLPKPPTQQVEVQKEIEQVDVVQPVEVKTDSITLEVSNTPVITKNVPKDSSKITQPSSDTIYNPYVMPIIEDKLPEIELYLPEKENLTKEEKIAEIRNLVTIFNAQLTKLYKDKEISYISGDHKIEILLEDSIEYYEDPVAFEKKSTSSFIRTTMTFIDDVQRLRKEAHQRYLKKYK